MMRYKNEKLQRSSHTEVSVARCAVCRLARRNWFRGHGLVELADARAFWIESDRLLASRRTAHLEQGSVRWIAWTARAKRPPASWLERTLETADAGGAGKIPSRPPCVLEPDDIAGAKARRLITARLPACTVARAHDESQGADKCGRQFYFFTFSRALWECCRDLSQHFFVK